jgi:eukaryotic-like serine/threonine-protein kinase
MIDFDGDLALLRGKIRQSESFRARARTLQARNNPDAGRFTAMLDSADLAAIILEDMERARAIFDRTVQQWRFDSIPLVDRIDTPYLRLAALLGDTVHPRQWAADYKAQQAELARTLDGPFAGELADAEVAAAYGRFEEALSHIQSAERVRGVRIDQTYPLKFIVLNRLQMADSAIAAGEKYVAQTMVLRLSQDALYLANIRQRLGELYEAKGNVKKALEHYTAFVELWKDADPELQPRVRDVRGRIERLQRWRG